MANSWLNILRPSPTAKGDGPARVAAMPFEAEYSRTMVDLYMFPWWRLLVVLAVLTAALWCPRVGIVAALAAFFYLADMGTLLTPFSSSPKAALA